VDVLRLRYVRDRQFAGVDLFFEFLQPQLFEGLSHGIRIASLPASQDDGFKQLPFLFAVTSPIGIVIGLLSFAKATDGGMCPIVSSLTFVSGLLITFFFDI